MKQTKILFFILFALTISFWSCEDDDEDTDKLPVKKETISAKWNVSNSETSLYKSFEFNESGNYIVIMNSSKKSTDSEVFFFGTYTIIDDETIELDDFGTIIIISLSENSFSFDFIPLYDPSSKISVSSTKAPELESSTNTELLCRTWQLVTLNGENVSGTTEELTVLFSEAGTYLVTYASEYYDDSGSIALWQWKDESEIYLCYSWEGDPTCVGDNEVLVELGTNSLTITEWFDDEEIIYYFIPAAETKSSQKSLQGNRSVKRSDRIFGIE